MLCCVSFEELARRLTEEQEKQRTPEEPKPFGGRLPTNLYLIGASAYELPY